MHGRQGATPPASGERRTSAAGKPTAGELCVWLGTLASWRGGLPGRLVREYGSVDEVLSRPAGELAAFLASPPARDDERSGSQTGPGGTTSARAGGGSGEAGADRRSYESVLASRPGDVACAAGGAGRVVVTWDDPLFPGLLRRLQDPPFCLFACARAGTDETRRRAGLLARGPVAAVVGTRKPSVYGSEMAALLGRDLALSGVVVVSGLALGIDAAAHAGALGVRDVCPPGAGAHNGGGGLCTVAVMGSGADVAYPAYNRRLHGEIRKHGLVVSEFAFGVGARAWRFPARNRVMAALCGAVVVVEGTARSGSRLTAGFALDVGVDVLAVPGEAGRSLTETPHQLLRDGAGLCESADDVLAALVGLWPQAGAVSRGPGSPEAGAASGAPLAGVPAGGSLAAVLAALQRTSLTADEVAAECRLTVQAAAAALSRLEIEGLVGLDGAGSYRLRKV